MDIIKNWDFIRQHFSKSFRSNFYVSIASVDINNNPTVTPIGSLFLNDNQTGFYFEKFAVKLSKNADSNPNICVLGVNSNRWFWIKSLFKGKFTNPPAIKLYGKLGEKRKATTKEIERLNRRMRATKSLKGNAYLWKKMDSIRDIKFTSAEQINLGKMTTIKNI
ncbi:hypothetical protein AWW67_10805 [Roseivirga seohaensis]|uniref:Pyridoxamine 5'-phosphate oxidase putative domain-containing protein n=1 Tax=Roseivirga seohaensis TaxID=1914963 RepID=A0A150XM24_9BACT|nr:hypothetical protein [Roseivirga seohaensis]KYG79798.1 hypothetical protein AWW67_10805 [Roseivirga seohaensis]